MWDSFLGWGGWGGVGTTVAWIVTVCLLISGLIGCFVPILPGHLIILGAAVAHRLMLGSPGSGLHWWSFVVLVAMMAISQAFEFFSGAAGAKWFGGTKWGAFGAFVGSIVGMFFMPWGLLAGPLVGAFVAEISFAKKELHPATVSGIGSVVGTLAGLAVKLAVGVAMILWFIADVFWVGN